MKKSKRPATGQKKRKVKEWRVYSMDGPQVTFEQVAQFFDDWFPMPKSGYVRILDDRDLAYREEFPPGSAGFFDKDGKILAIHETLPAMIVNAAHEGYQVLALH